jgi:hypothetical protein
MIGATTGFPNSLAGSISATVPELIGTPRNFLAVAQIKGAVVKPSFGNRFAGSPGAQRRFKSSEYVTTESGATCWSVAASPILHYDRTGFAAHTPARTLSCAQMRSQRSQRAEAICVGHTEGQPANAAVRRRANGSRVHWLAPQTLSIDRQIAHG